MQLSATSHANNCSQILHLHLLSVDPAVRDSDARNAAPVPMRASLRAKRASEEH